MTRTSYIAYFTLTAFATTGLALAQDQQPLPPQDQSGFQQNNSQNRGWRRADSPALEDAPALADAQAAPFDNQADPNGGGQNQGPPPPPVRGRGPSGQPAAPPNYDNYPPQQSNMRQGPPPEAVPSTLTVKPGTYVTVRVNQVLSSDHNHPGDAFSATLVKPVVVDGVVIADRGQTIGGRVGEAKKAGYVQGTSSLGVQLTDLTLVDGQNIPIQSQLITRDGGTSVGRDAGAIAGTTALGAAIGANVDWGRGAAIGAGAGAAAGILGVLLTRGHASVIYPEQILTFRVDSPITISTSRAPMAFHYVQPGEYDQPQDLQRRPPPMRAAAPGPYYGGGYFYGPSYYPSYWGPSFGFYYGGRGYYGRGYYGRGYYYGRGGRR